MPVNVVDVGRGIRLCYDQIGDESDPPIVLVAGLGQQFHSWPQEFAEPLANRGYRVIRTDNRDVGRSMCGMIAQTVAAHYPGRVRTLTSLMSTTGAPRIGRAATGKAIPSARMETVVGMGHDLPRGAWSRLLDLIIDHTARSQVSGPTPV